MKNQWKAHKTEGGYKVYSHRQSDIRMEIYEDGSGEISIGNPTGMRSEYCTDFFIHDGSYKDKIEYLEEAIQNAEKLKKALKILKQLKGKVRYDF